jgi:RNA polymerase sigma-70 factor (ECF subfamily)
MESPQGPSETASEDVRWIRTALDRPGSQEAQEAYARLLRKYWKVIMILVLTRIADRREAEDTCQEAFVRAFRSLSKLEEPAAFLGWLLRISRNLITDHLRARKSFTSLDALGDDAAGAAAGTAAGAFPSGLRDTKASFEEEIEAREEMDLVWKAVAQLPERYREVVVLKYVQGLDGKGMAGVLGEPEGTLRNRLFRALDKLREILAARRVRGP